MTKMAIVFPALSAEHQSFNIIMGDAAVLNANPLFPIEKLRITQTPGITHDARRADDIRPYGLVLLHDLFSITGYSRFACE